MSRCWAPSCWPSSQPSRAARRVTIRQAVLADVPVCTAIYNYYVEVGVSTFDEQPRSAVQGLEWYSAHRDPRYPLIVWELGEDLLGFGTLSRWSKKSGYDRSVEVSVFVSPGHLGQGGGRLLLSRLIAMAEEAGHHVLLGRIEASNKDSLILFQRSGFTPVGVLREVGFKQERWLDVLILERILKNLNRSLNARACSRVSRTRRNPSVT